MMFINVKGSESAAVWEMFRVSERIRYFLLSTMIQKCALLMCAALVSSMEAAEATGASNMTELYLLPHTHAGKVFLYGYPHLHHFPSIKTTLNILQCYCILLSLCDYDATLS